jgi:hypothetical protein
MTYEIPHSVRVSTTHCPHGFKCLESGKCGKVELCEVNRVVGPMMAFISDACQSCGYYLMYGNSHVCTCPTRIALHQQYGV